MNQCCAVINSPAFFQSFVSRHEFPTNQVPESFPNVLVWQQIPTTVLTMPSKSDSFLRWLVAPAGIQSVFCISIKELMLFRFASVGCRWLPSERPHSHFLEIVSIQGTQGGFILLCCILKDAASCIEGTNKEMEKGDKVTKDTPDITGQSESVELDLLVPAKTGRDKKRKTILLDTRRSHDLDRQMTRLGVHV